MKSKRSLRFFSNTLTAAGLVLAVSACSTVYQNDWDQSSGVPDLNDPGQRSEALLAYCKKLHDRGDLNLAVGICNRAHEIDPTDPDPLIELARVLEDLEMTSSAEEAYRAALLLDPEQTDALYGLGKIYIDQQRYDLAMEPLEAAAQAKSEDPRIYNALGVIKDQQGQHAEAQTYYREGLTHSPRNISLRNNLGLSMVLAGEPEAGLAMLRDVAAEPAAGATAGRNLEMASQIAAQNILAEPSDDLGADMSPDMGAEMGAADTAEPAQQADASAASPSAESLATQELSSLSPSATPETSKEESGKEEASKPLPLLQVHPDDEAGAATASTQPAQPETTPKYARSLDQEMADAMAPQPEAEDGIQTAEASADAPAATSEQTAALPPAAPTADEEIHTARDWTMAAQTVFATSRVAVAEPSQITSQERTALNDSFHASPTPEAAEPGQTPGQTDEAMTAQAEPQGELAMVPASTAAESDAAASTSGGYGIDEDTFYTAQLASFRSAERARAGWQILKDSAGELLAQSDAHIVRADLGPELGIYYRVRTGSMADRAAATQFCQDLQAEGLECMPVEASVQETSATLVDKICETGSTDAICTTAAGSGSKSDDPRPPHIRG